MSSFFRPVSAAALILSIIFSLASCSSEHSESAGDGDLSLKIGAMSSMDILPFLVAEEIGAYDSLGLDLEVVKFYSANDRDAAFQSGNVEGTVIDYTGAMMQQAAGIPLKLVMKLDGYFELMASPGFSGSDVATLRGKNVGVSSNTVIEYATDMMTERAGLEEEDYIKTEVNKIPLRLEMLKGGQMDATILPDPFITMAKQAGMVSLASTADMGISVTGLILSEETMAQKSEAVGLLIEGYDEGVDYILSHPLADLIPLLTEDLGFTGEAAAQVVLPRYTHSGKPSEKDLEATKDWLLKKGLIPEEYNLALLTAES